MRYSQHGRLFRKHRTQKSRSRGRPYAHASRNTSKLPRIRHVAQLGGSSAGQVPSRRSQHLSHRPSGQAVARSGRAVGRGGRAAKRPGAKAPRRPGGRAVARSGRAIRRGDPAARQTAARIKGDKASAPGGRAATQPRGRAGEGREGAGAGGAGAAGAARRAGSWIRSSSKPVPNQFQTSSKPVPNPVPNPPHIGI